MLRLASKLAYRSRSRRRGRRRERPWRPRAVADSATSLASTSLESRLEPLALGADSAPASRDRRDTVGGIAEAIAGEAPIASSEASPALDHGTEDPSRAPTVRSFAHRRRMAHGSTDLGSRPSTCWWRASHLWRRDVCHLAIESGGLCLSDLVGSGGGAVSDRTRASGIVGAEAAPRGVDRALPRREHPGRGPRRSLDRRTSPSGAGGRAPPEETGTIPEPTPSMAGTIARRRVVGRHAAYHAAMASRGDDEEDLRQSHETLIPRACLRDDRRPAAPGARRPCGAWPARRHSRGSAGLTPREPRPRAGGRGADQLGDRDRLVISEKTVGHHVSSILGKLGSLPVRRPKLAPKIGKSHSQHREGPMRRHDDSYRRGSTKGEVECPLHRRAHLRRGPRLPTTDDGALPSLVVENNAARRTWLHSYSRRTGERRSASTTARARTIRRRRRATGSRDSITPIRVLDPYFYVYAA